MSARSAVQSSQAERTILKYNNFFLIITYSKFVNENGLITHAFPKDKLDEILKL